MRWVLLLTALLAGCITPPPVPEDRYYRLVDPRAATPSASVAPLLVVQALSADGLHAGRAILYSKDPGHRTLQRYHYHFWRDVPPRLVQDYLVAYLRLAGVADRVSDAGEDVPGAYRVGGRLKRFEQLTGEGPMQAAIALELWVEADGAGRLWFADYQATVPVTGTAFTDLVLGFEQGLERIGGEFVADLSKLAVKP